MTTRPAYILPTARVVQEVQINWPNPSLAETNSAATMTSKDTPNARRRPVKIAGKLAGRMTLTNSFQPVAP